MLLPGQLISVTNKIVTYPHTPLLPKICRNTRQAPNQKLTQYGKILPSHLARGFGGAGLFCNYSPIFALFGKFPNGIIWDQNTLNSHQIAC